MSCDPGSDPADVLHGFAFDAHGRHGRWVQLGIADAMLHLYKLVTSNNSNSDFVACAPYPRAPAEVPEVSTSTMDQWRLHPSLLGLLGLLQTVQIGDLLTASGSPSNIPGGATPGLPHWALPL